MANTDWMGAALGKFARWADLEGYKLLVVLVDNAGWHVAKRLEVPPDVLPALDATVHVRIIGQ